MKSASPLFCVIFDEFLKEVEVFVFLKFIVIDEQLNDLIFRERYKFKVRFSE